MSNLGLSEQEVAAANAALTEFVNSETGFNNTEANCKTLQTWLKSRGVPVSRWNLESFVLAYGMCKREGTLEAPPPPKSQIQIEIEKNSRGQFEGRNREEMQEAEARARHEARNKELESREAVEAQRSDMGLVPTAEQIVSSHTEGSESFGKFPYAWHLSGSAASSWGKEQLKLYFKRSRAAESVLNSESAEERNARIRDKQRLLGS